MVDKVRASLKRKIGLLLETDGNALLSSHIHGHRTRTPRYARRPQGVKVEQVLQDDKEASLDYSTLLAEQIQLNTTDFDLERAPLWNVKILRQGERFAIVLNCHHLIMDGRGLANLFEILLSSSEELPAHSLLSGGIKGLEEAPASAEESVPGYELGFVGRTAIKVFTMLPKSIQAYLDKQTTWPATAKILHHPAKATEVHHVTILKGGSVLSTLKEQANLHGVKTIHPIIHMASLIALHSILPNGTKINCDSPLNERRPKERHTLCTGNYISAVRQS